MRNWKDNRRVQVAVGIAIVFLGARWLFSPSLQDAALAYNSPPPQDGDVASPMTAMAMIWPVVEIAIAVFAGIGAYAINLGELLWSKVQAASSDQELATADSTGIDPIEIQRSLVRAVAMNDQEEAKRLKSVVRRPYAISELARAAEEGDFDTVTLRLEELRKMLAEPKEPNK